MTTFEGDQHVIVAAQHILKALGATKNLNDDVRRALMELDAHLAAMTLVADREVAVLNDIEERLKCAERKVMRWELNPAPIWDSPLEASEYLQAVNGIQAVIESLEVPSVNRNGKLKELARRAQSALQIAMSRLEEEVSRILVQNKQFSDPQYTSFRSCAEEMAYDESFVSLEDEVVEESEYPERDSTSRESLEYVVDLVSPQVIPNIKSIANIMFASDYGREFCEAFTGIRRIALDEYLPIMEVEKLSIEVVLKLEWESLNSMIKKWMWAMKNITRVYLASEKQLCQQILGDLGCVSLFCFVEIAKDSFFCLLNFGEAVAMGPHGPEKLCRLLDMYEVLADLLPDVDGLFSEEAGSFPRAEFHELLGQLGDSVRATFLRFKNAIASDASAHPVPGAAIHPLTRYVMNYLRLLTEYGATLRSLLRDQEVDDLNTAAEMDWGREDSYSISCPVGRYFLSVASILESNLIQKSKLYRDSSPEHIFLMNNIHYMVQKVMGSDLRLFFGDEWTRRHKGKFQQHATSYWGVTWNSVVSLLRDDGKTSRKERCRRFTNAFDEVYKSQIQWHIPDAGLREDQQISASQKVIHAYQSFVGSHSDDKFLKYSVEDMEKMFLALFVTPPKSLRNSRKR